MVPNYLHYYCFSKKKMLKGGHIALPPPIPPVRIGFGYLTIRASLAQSIGYLSSSYIKIIFKSVTEKYGRLSLQSRGRKLSGFSSPETK